MRAHSAIYDDALIIVQAYNSPMVVVVGQDLDSSSASLLCHPEIGVFYPLNAERLGAENQPPTQNERLLSTSNYLKEPHAKARIRESPSICIPVQPIHASTHHIPQLPLSPTTLIQQNHVDSQSTYSLQNQLPQIFVPEDGKLERRCSFVRQVEEVGKKEEDVLDRCNHICNFEIKDKQWEANTQYYLDERDVFGSLDYPFSEVCYVCSIIDCRYLRSQWLQ